MPAIFSNPSLLESCFEITHAVPGIISMRIESTDSDVEWSGSLPHGRSVHSHKAASKLEY